MRYAVLEVRSVPTAAVTSDIGFFRGPEGAIAPTRKRRKFAPGNVATTWIARAQAKPINETAEHTNLVISAHHVVKRVDAAARDYLTPDDCCARARPAHHVVPAGTFWKGSNMKMANANLNRSSGTETTAVAPSALIRSAHLIERIGLAAIGGSSGLYVAAGLLRRQHELPGSIWIVVLMMLFGAFSFYIGIDLPRRSARRAASTQQQGWSTDTAVELLSAVGIFLAAMATFVSVGIIILDEPVSDVLLASTGSSWMIGASFQIAAGIIARNYGTTEDAGK